MMKKLMVVVLAVAILISAGSGIGHYAWPRVEVDTIFSTTFLYWDGNETIETDYVPCDTWVQVFNTAADVREDDWWVRYSVRVDCPTPTPTPTPRPRTYVLQLQPLDDNYQWMYITVPENVFYYVRDNMDTYNLMLDDDVNVMRVIVSAPVSLCPKVGDYVPLNWPSLIDDWKVR